MQGNSEQLSGNITAKFRFYQLPGSYECNQCGNLYRWYGNLRQHQNFECGKEPRFSCPLCNKQFKQKSNMKTHIKNVHRKIPSEFV